MPAAAVRVMAVEGGFEARVRHGDGEPRVLEAETCEAVARAVALVLALRMRPAEATEEEPTVRASVIAPLREPAVALAEPSTRRSLDASAEVAPGPVVELRLGARFVLDAGVMPGAAPGVSLSVGVAYDALLVELAASWLPGQRAQVTGSRAGGDVEMLAVGARGCARTWAVPTVELAACGALELGRLSAAGFGVSEPSRGESLFLGLFAGGVARWWLDALGLELGVELSVPVVRPQFVLVGVGTVHQPAEVGVRAYAGAQWRFR